MSWQILITYNDMGSYAPLAIKYRPRKLRDMIGHEVLIRTISNAINNKRIHNAYILTGTRGIGKTTTARIIALSLNCIGKDGNSQETSDPCMECVNCKQIINNSHPDIIEFDAASNTGVDSIRDIIDNCQYQPSMARYKVYIIDEVHMLSKAAFNALLKTLEEPPTRVKFIFATTEIRKIPITIISRCQKFLLKPMSEDLLAKHLQNISNLESFKLDNEGAKVIAEYANGSVRDALSLLDQVIINLENGSKQINYDIVKNAINVYDYNKSAELFYYMLNSDIEKSLELAKECNVNYSSIKDIVHSLLLICNELTKHITIKKSKLQDMISEVNFANLIKKVSLAQLIRVWNILIQCLNESENFDDISVIEIAVSKIALSNSIPTPAEILKVLEDDKLLEIMANIPNAQVNG